MGECVDMIERIGVKTIKIPVLPKDLTKDKIETYLPTILEIFVHNAGRIIADYDYCFGRHGILNKTRMYDDQTDINNKIVEPHLQAIVNFKCGHLLGIPKTYTQGEDKNNDDIDALNKYNRDINLHSIDLDATKWAYSTGVGYYFCQPREGSFDVKKEAPYEVYCLDSNTCAKVYSSYIGNKELFDIIVTSIAELDKNGTKTKYYIMDIYTADTFYEYKINSNNYGKYNLVRAENRPVYKFLPLVERYFNSDRLGLVRFGRSINDALDRISSNSLDNLEETVNQILVFLNCTIGKSQEEKKDNLKNFRKNGAIEIASGNPQLPADIKTITNKLLNSDINVLRENLVTVLYDSTGTPRASSIATSGGDTQGARELGNGWENAQIMTRAEIAVFSKSDKELLDRMLFICKMTDGCLVDKVDTSDIEIKYNYGMHNNIQVKSQAFGTFIANGVPSEVAINWCQLDNDAHTIGGLIDRNREKLGLNTPKTNKVVENKEIVEPQANE